MFDIQEELRKLPEKPGVYIMKDEKGTIIYIGKAVVLKNRVRQYFQISVNHSPKVQAMVAKISEFEYIVTDSELEALILECNLIKMHKPRFNILLKDDKNYPYIKITMNDEYPRIYMTRRPVKDGARYFGPYSNVQVIRETTNLLKKIFPIKTCKRVLPRDIGKARPCLNYFIHQCLGPCSGNVAKDDYKALMKDVCALLDGKHDAVVKKLEEQMSAAAENMEYEKAAAYRNKISSLRQIAEKQKIISTNMTDQDVIGFAGNATDTCIQIFFVRGGKLSGREHFIFEGVGENEIEELLSSFIKQFYSQSAHVPAELILQRTVSEQEVLESWLSTIRSGKVHIKVPQKGEKLQLVEMVSQNAFIELTHFKEKMTGGISAVREGLEGMAAVLGMDEPPHRIEAFDISNTGDSEIVASMVVFVDGLPDKKGYRHYKVKSSERQNDYASMQEVIFRRFRKGELGDGSLFYPDIILVDGGLGHVNSITRVLEELSVEIRVFGMVKDDRHRTRGLVSPDKEVDITKNLPLLRLVTSIQDEAHRFAVEYNRKLRKKRYSISILDEVEGIGPKRKVALLKHFGSLVKIGDAGIDDLLAVEGISRTAAEKVHEFFSTRKKH